MLVRFMQRSNWWNVPVYKEKCWFFFNYLYIDVKIEPINNPRNQIGVELILKKGERKEQVTICTSFRFSVFKYPKKKKKSFLSSTDKTSVTINLIFSFIQKLMMDTYVKQKGKILYVIHWLSYSRQYKIKKKIWAYHIAFPILHYICIDPSQNTFL